MTARPRLGDPPAPRSEAETALGVLVAVVVGALLAAVLLHCWEPCPAGHLCAAGALCPQWLRQGAAGLLRRGARLYRRLHARALRARAWQLDCLAASLAVETDRASGVRFGIALARAAELRGQAYALEQRP